MSVLTKGDPRAQKIDAALQSWRQGDFTLGDVWLAHIADGSAALTEVATKGDGVHAAVYEVGGVVVVTQTCDVVRACTDRPFVCVAPLIKLEDSGGNAVAVGMSPRYARVATRPDLVADLDQVVSIEKSLVASWERLPGWTTDDELREFAASLARKAARFAFPDDFTLQVAKGLQRRVKEKHDKDSDEGKALRALREIRVSASPSWDSEKVSLFFFFIRDEEPEALDIKWDQHLSQWLKLCKPFGTVTRIEGRVTTLDGMTAREYVESDQLDLDHLSDRTDADQ